MSALRLHFEWEQCGYQLLNILADSKNNKFNDFCINNAILDWRRMRHIESVDLFRFSLTKLKKDIIHIKNINI